MKNLTFLLLLTLTSTISSFAQNTDTEKEKIILLDNRLVKQEIIFDQGSLSSAFLGLEDDKGYNFIHKSENFSFFANDKPYNGFSQWNLLAIDSIYDADKIKEVRIVLKEKAETPGLIIELNYLLYPDLPIIRKWIKIRNIGKYDIKLESVNVEVLNTHLKAVSSVILHDYARMKHIGRFVGNWNDPLVVVHNIPQRRGLALGNEAISILKRTAYHTTQENNIEIGLTQPGQNFPFRKWIKPGEEWESPRIFLCPYNNSDDGFQVVNNQVNRFMIRYLKPAVIRRKEKPTFIYDTWNPFRTFVSDSLIREVAKAAAECGIQEFIIDDGWQVNHLGKTTTQSWGSNYGDWLVDHTKFPEGLKPTFNYIKSLGMKPGLWFSVASATPDARVFKEHPEWFVKTREGKPGNLHNQTTEGKFYTASMGTNWYHYIKKTLLKFVKDYGLSYAKLDFAVVASAYVNDDLISGDYAVTSLYRDRHESFGVIYNRLIELFDELKKEVPDLFIDCTFETAGKLQLMDYAIAESADGNWFSNFEEPYPTGPLRVRQMAWWRSPVVPASSLIIGNLPMNDSEFLFSLKSLIGTLPVVLGDPRKIAPGNRKIIREWADWMKTMQKKYDYMSYRKDLTGFGEPKDGYWDGWQRINFDTGAGGIWGVFRQGALDSSRTVYLEDLIPEKNYVVRLAPSGQMVFRGSGKTFMQQGIRVDMEAKYDAKIFEVGIEE